MIELINVSKVYPNGVKALNNANLKINKGEIVSIIGLSGAGKSTLLRCINKMIDTSSGEVLFEGKSVTKSNRKDLRMIRRDIGMIFQSFNLVKRNKVITNVLCGRIAFHPTIKTIFGLFPKKDKLIAYDALERVNILDKTFSRADELSGGQMQRVAIARSLAQQPKLILADEPVASLDPLTTIQVMDDLKRINNELGITMIINLHHVDLALKYSTRIIGLKDGEIVFDASPKEVDNKALKKIYGRELISEEIFGE